MKKMQYKSNEYDPDKHDRFKALVVKQPYAEDLADGVKTIELRKCRTKYRGDVLVCSSKNPKIPPLLNGCALALVELYDVKPVSEFTPEDWNATRVPVEKRASIKYGYGWLFRNPRRVIEFPVHGQLGLFNLVYTKGVIEEYPTHVIFDRDFDIKTKSFNFAKKK